MVDQTNSQAVNPGEQNILNAAVHNKVQLTIFSEINSLCIYLNKSSYKTVQKTTKRSMCSHMKHQYILSGFN